MGEGRKRQRERGLKGPQLVVRTLKMSSVHQWSEILFRFTKVPVDDDVILSSFPLSDVIGARHSWP